MASPEADTQQTQGSIFSPFFNLLEQDRINRLRFLQAMPPQRRLLHVFMLSAVGFFLELLLIRWLDAQVRPLAYVKNLPLIGSFLGLGIGFSLSQKRKSLFPLSLFCLFFVLLSGSLLGMSGTGVVISGPAGPQSNLGIGVATNIAELWIFYLIVIGIFGLVVLAMVPLGQITGVF